MKSLSAEKVSLHKFWVASRQVRQLLKRDSTNTKQFIRNLELSWKMNLLKKFSLSERIALSQGKRK